MPNQIDLSQSFSNFAKSLIMFSGILGYFYSTYRFLAFAWHNLNLFQVICTFAISGLLWGIVGLILTKFIRPQNIIENILLSSTFFGIVVFSILQNTLITMIIVITCIALMSIIYIFKYFDIKQRESRILERQQHMQQRVMQTDKTT